MDAKPQRPARVFRARVDENSLAFNRAGKTIHQRNKSTPALSTLAGNAGNAGNAVSKEQQQSRRAFGDVSNTVNAYRSAKDDSSLPSKDAVKIAEKPLCLARPAQRPIHSINPRITVNTSANTDLNLKAAVDKAQSKKIQSKRSNAVFKDPVLQSVVEEPGLPPVKGEQASPAKHGSADVVPQNTATATSESQKGSKAVAHDVKADIIPAPSIPAILEEPAAKAAVETESHITSKTVAASSNEMANVKKEPRISNEGDRKVSKPSVKRPSDTTVSSRKHDYSLVQSEPEEYWDEEEDDDDYDEDGYATARSCRSRDNTTLNATMVLFPKVTQQARRELALAKQLMDAAAPTLDEYDDDLWDTTMVAEYGDDIFQYMRELELRLLPNAHYMDNQAEIQWSMRSVLMDWLVQVHHRFSLLPETLFLCVNYIDRFLSCKVVSLGKLQLVGATAIFIAAKYEEINCPSVQEIVFMVDNGYTVDEILKAERFMLGMLQFELGWPGPMSFLRRVSKADRYDLETRTLAKYFLELTIMDERFVGTPPSFIAAGAHCLARLMLGKGDWGPEHVYYSNYTYGQLHQLVSLILECCESPQKHHMAIFEKYADRRFKGASVFVENEMLNGFRLPSVHEGSSLWSMLERRASSKRL